MLVSSSEIFMLLFYDSYFLFAYQLKLVKQKCNTRCVYCWVFFFFPFHPDLLTIGINLDETQ